MKLLNTLSRLANAVALRLGYVPERELFLERETSQAFSALNKRKTQEIRNLERDVHYEKQRARVYEAAAVKNLSLKVPFWGINPDAKVTLDYDIERRLNAFLLYVPAFEFTFIVDDLDLSRHPEGKEVVYEIYAKKFGKKYGEAVTAKVLDILNPKGHEHGLRKPVATASDGLR